MTGTKEVALYLDGELVETGTVRQIADKYGWDYNLIYEHLRKKGKSCGMLLHGSNVYTVAYTGQMISALQAESRGRPAGRWVSDTKDPDPDTIKRRVTKSRAQHVKIEAEARAHGMSYGKYVGLLAAKEGRR